MTRAEHESLSDYLLTRLSPDERRHIGLVSFNQWPFVAGAIAETALEALSIGSDVTIALWADSAPLHDPGWSSSRRVARLLGSRTRDENLHRALLSAGLATKSFARPPLVHLDESAMPSVHSPMTRSQLRSLRYRNSDMGRSILQVHPNDNTPIRDTHEWPIRYVELAIRSYAWAFDQTQALIRERGLTTVAVYNGRFTHDRAVAAAADQLGVRVLYYDTGGYETDFDLTTAATHDWADLQHRMFAMYESWDPDERDEIGSRWFVNRQSHVDARNRLFTGIQTRGHLEGVPDADTVVVYFSSSGDEIVELDLEWADYLHSQEQALADLSRAVHARPGTALVVRTHPHMRLKPPDDLADWTAAVDSAGPDIHFGPESSVDSYALMDAADVVFTYGSTAGVEAAYFGRPVVVMGPSAYDELGCATRITSAAEIPGLLDSPPIPNPRAAIPYGLMMERRGFSYRHVQGRGNDISLAGIALAEASPWTLKISDALNRRTLKRLTSR